LILSLLQRLLVEVFHHLAKHDGITAATFALFGSDARSARLFARDS